MCWVISTGARSSTPPICATMALSACGPPVEAPISSTRGGVAGIGRSAIGWPARRAAAGLTAAARCRRRPGCAAQMAVPQALGAQAELADFLDQFAAEGRRAGDFAVAVRLGDIVGGAERQRAQADLGVAPRQRRGHDHDQVALLREQQRQRGDAVELRHVDVEHHHVGIGALDLVDRLAPGAQRGDQLRGPAPPPPSARTGRARPRRRPRS